MIAVLQWDESAPLFTPLFHTIYVHQVPLLHIRLRLRPPFLSYRWKKVGRTLAERHITRLLPPEEDFPYWHLLRPYQVQAYDSTEGLQRLGAVVAQRYLAQAHIPLEQAIVSLEGQRVTSPVEEVALALCPQIPRLVLSFPQGGSQLGERLFQQYGMAPCLHHPQPHLRLAFSPKAHPSALPLYQKEAPCFQQLHTQDFPSFLPPLPFLDLLLETGKLSPPSLLPPSGEASPHLQNISPSFS